jgi:hypothetical protein
VHARIEVIGVDYIVARETPEHNGAPILILDEDFDIMSEVDTGH